MLKTLVIRMLVGFSSGIGQVRVRDQDFVRFFE